MMEKNGMVDQVFEAASDDEKKQLLSDLMKELREMDEDLFFIVYAGLKELIKTGSREKAMKKMAWFAGMTPKGFERWRKEGGSSHNPLSTWYEPNKTLASGEIYTLNEVAEILKVSYRSVLKYVETGALMAVKVGGKWRVKASDLEDFVTAKK